MSIPRAKAWRAVDFRMEMEQTKEGIHNLVEKAFASNRISVAQPRGLGASFPTWRTESKRRNEIKTVYGGTSSK